MVPSHANVEPLRAAWIEVIRPSGRAACLGLACLGALAAVQLARLGTDAARLGALSLLVLSAALPVLLALRSRRLRCDPATLVRGAVVGTDPPLGAALLRALRLAHSTAAAPDRGPGAPQASPGLARLHLVRLLGRVRLGPVAARASGRAWTLSAVALGAAGACLALMLADPFRVVEGLDVLVARAKVAPVCLDWLADASIAAEPPSYLRRQRELLRPYFPAALPRGSVLVVQAVPLHAGRSLVLTDGAREAAFVPDGSGVLVARWRLEDDAALYVAARFGQVLVYEPDGIELHALADQPPYVRLAGAPRTIRLLDEARIPIHWEASDDHGLEEIELVLQVGEQEQRRPLSRPQGRTRIDRGGIELRSGDDLLRRSFLPVRVTVQARDGDPIAGPKWGHSAAIVIVPPEVGEREARDYAALRRGRDLLTDALAERLQGAPPTAARREAHLERERELDGSTRAAVLGALAPQGADIGSRGALAALVEGQLERLTQAVRAERRAPAAPGHRRLVATTESALLAIDAGLAALGHYGSRAAARKLADVATEAANAIAALRRGAAPEVVDRRLGAALAVLDGGGRNLRALGRLGLDLGEIVQNDLRRIRRAWQAGDAYHAQLAAEDLAARLHAPDPSLRSAGGGGLGGGAGGGGVEAGPGTGAGAGEGEASAAAREAAKLLRALQELRDEHAAEMAGVERLLRESLDDADREAMQGELRRHAEAVRRAVADLPEPGAAPSPPGSAAAAGRSQGEAMAGALDDANLNQAVGSGKQAAEALREAERLARGAAGTAADPALGQRAAQAREALERELEWAEQARRDWQRRASERARAELERAARREKDLAQRARKLAEQGAGEAAPMPEAMVERIGQAGSAMDQAGRLLGGGNGEQGLERQREAQRLLDMAAGDQDGAAPDKGEEGDRGESAQDTQVPGGSRDERADRFRQRVLEGLKGRATPALREAVRRYAEGLLR
ncbi:MAG: DUF4175 domain-containing protein [Deltaproteobacteria bacterium]|nr:DUF4175 domain-containing protein [Deltaproteobacteria bacterium]